MVDEISLYRRFSNRMNRQFLSIFLALFLANVRIADALYCLRCFGVPDSCSRPSNSQTGAVSVEQCAPNQYWCKSWATQYNVMMGCTETCRPTDPQTLCCQKDMCNCFGSNCYEQLLTSNPPVWFTPGGQQALTTWRPQPQHQPPTTPSTNSDFVWPPWWTSSTTSFPSIFRTSTPLFRTSTDKALVIYQPTQSPGQVGRCYECYDCGSKFPPTQAYCPPNRNSFCVIAVVNFIGLRRIDRFCSDICPPRQAGYVQTQCCDKENCNLAAFNNGKIINQQPFTILLSVFIAIFSL